MQLDPSIVTKSITPPTAYDRVRDYQDRMHAYLTALDASEQVAVAVAVEAKPAALPVAHNISQFLRGAK